MYQFSQELWKNFFNQLWLNPTDQRIFDRIYTHVSMAYNPPLDFFSVPEVHSKSIGYGILKCGVTKKKTRYYFSIIKPFIEYMKCTPRDQGKDCMVRLSKNKWLCLGVCVGWLAGGNCIKPNLFIHFFVGLGIIINSRTVSLMLREACDSDCQVD